MEKETDIVISLLLMALLDIDWFRRKNSFVEVVLSLFVDGFTSLGRIFDIRKKSTLYSLEKTWIVGGWTLSFHLVLVFGSR